MKKEDSTIKKFNFLGLAVKMAAWADMARLFAQPHQNYN